jgi:stage II sporulation protein M
MIFLSTALWTRLGTMLLLRISGKISTEEILSTLKWSISFYFRWILPLLFVAAVIETFITPVVMWMQGDENFLCQKYIGEKTKSF